MKRFPARLLALILLLAFALTAFSACGSGETETEKVVIRVKDYGEITVELLPQYAPITVANFKKLVGERFYDGSSFHRVINNFMIQGGKGKTQADMIKGEFKANGVDNALSHERGVISMARATPYDSASSQFFICHNTDTCRALDGKYAAFGRVLSGMEVVDAIAAVRTDVNDMPLYEVVIESIRFV